MAVREYEPDIVLLDIGLPGMDGYEVARCVRDEMGDDAPLLVAMTGYGQHEVNRHARKAEFDHHLVKPADMSALRELLGARSSDDRRIGAYQELLSRDFKQVRPITSRTTRETSSSTSGSKIPIGQTMSSVNSFEKKLRPLALLAGCC